MLHFELKIFEFVAKYVNIDIKNEKEIHYV